MANNSMTATGIEEQKQQALSDSEKMYTDMANKSDEFYQAQIAESQKWADRMAQIQQERTDFAIEQIEQQKEQAQKDYIKEQSGAYVDWQKESNKYGANAEQMASAGLLNDGYGESSQVSMFNTYQNRVATAREAISRAMLDFDNAIKDARLQNSAAQAEIAYNALQQQMGLALQGFQYKNQLLTEQANKRMEIDTNYFNRYLSVLKELEGDGPGPDDVPPIVPPIGNKKTSVDSITRNYMNDFYQEYVNPYATDKGRTTYKDSAYSREVNGNITGITGTATIEDANGKTITTNVYKAADGTRWYQDPVTQKFTRIE